MFEFSWDSLTGNHDLLNSFNISHVYIIIMKKKKQIINAEDLNQYFKYVSYLRISTFIFELSNIFLETHTTRLKYLKYNLITDKEPLRFLFYNKSK